MDKIKIVFVLGTLDIGGTETQFLEMLRKLDRNSFVPQVLSFRRHGTIRRSIEELLVPFKSLDFSSPGGRLHPRLHPASYLRVYKLIRDMVRYFSQESPHIVQSYLPAGNIFGAIAAKIAGVPVIITGRRAIIDERYIKFPKFPDQWLQDISNLWVTVIIANSYSVKSQCLQRERFATKEKIRVIYNGVNLARYGIKNDPLATKRGLGIPENSQIIGVIATLDPRKGHQDILKAAPLVLRKFPKAKFLLVGRDDGVQKMLEKLIEELNIGASILFTGERDDIPEILSMLDVQVSPSYTEGLSNAILEGMAAGKPIVATNIAGNPELIVNGETGLLVPLENPSNLADAIVQILSDARKREQMGMAGRRRVEKLFRLEHMIRNNELLYQQLVKAHITSKN